MTRLAKRLPLVLVAAAACSDPPPADRVRVSGYVEADEVRIASELGGRILEVRAAEGDRVNAGDLVILVDAREIDIAIDRAAAERRGAVAQLQLLEEGARSEDIQQAVAQADVVEADLSAWRAELASAEEDFQRFERLLQANAGSRKQRDDAAARRDVARERVRAGEERVRAARQAVERLRRLTRPQELEAARSSVAVIDAQIASLQKRKKDSEVFAPSSGVVVQRLVDPGEVAAPLAPLLVTANLDRPWVNVYVEGPAVPLLRLKQPATERSSTSLRPPSSRRATSRRRPNGPASSTASRSWWPTRTAY
jgi:HlyD family secretion protein